MFLISFTTAFCFNRCCANLSRTNDKNISYRFSQETELLACKSKDTQVLQSKKDPTLKESQLFKTCKLTFRTYIQPYNKQTKNNNSAQSCI